MNKKFLVVALMAALSTVGYAVTADDLNDKLFAEGTGVIGNLENKDTELQNQVNGLNDKLFAEGTGVLGNLENKDTELQNQVNDLNDKLFAEGTGVLGNLENKDTELQNQVNDLNDKLFAEGTGVLGNLEVADQNLQDQIDGMKTDISNAGLAADAANEGMLQNKEDIKDINDKIKDYDTVKEEANSALILGQENDKKINDLYANKVDNQKFEEHKKQQANKDKDQDDKIQANKDAIAQNKNDIAANKDAIEKETADRLAADEKLQGQIDKFNDKFAGYDGRLSGLEKKVDHLDDKMNKGLSLMAAMNAVDFQNVQTGEMALGAGIGHYGNAQSVALGVAYAPVEDLTVNAKYSITAGDPDSFAVGAGATYKFKVGR